MRQPPLVFLLAVLAILSACGGHAPPVDAALVAKAVTRWPEASDQTLATGRELLVTRCTKCHGIRTPSDYTLSEWRGYLREMAPKAELDEAQVQSLLRYVTVAREMAQP